MHGKTAKNISLFEIYNEVINLKFFLSRSILKKNSVGDNQKSGEIKVIWIKYAWVIMNYEEMDVHLGSLGCLYPAL